MPIFIIHNRSIVNLYSQLIKVIHKNLSKFLYLDKTLILLNLNESFKN